MTQRFEHSFFSYVTQRILTLFLNIHRAVFFKWFKEVNIIRKCNSKNLFCLWKLLNFSLSIDSKNRSFIFLKMSQWIGPLFFGLWRKEYLLPNMTRTELSSSKYDAKNWTFWVWLKFCFFKRKNDSQNSAFILRIWPTNWLYSLEYDAKNWAPFISWIWRTELNPLFSNLSRIELFFQRIELFLFLIRLKVLNFSF